MGRGRAAGLPVRAGQDAVFGYPEEVRKNAQKAKTGLAPPGGG